MRRILGLISVILVLLFVSTAAAADPSIEIDRVGSRAVKDGEVKGTVKGKTLVQGSSIPSGATSSTPAAKPLVADAGDSGFVGSGGLVTLLGAGFGGAEPYTFAWTTTAGTLHGADAPTAQVDTTGVAPGTYSATVTVTDSKGATATDSVKFVVYTPTTGTLLDETKADNTPGVLGAGAPGAVEFQFNVPAGTSKIDIVVSWTLLVNDYDMRVLRPDGSQADSKGAAAGVPERSIIQNPVPGTWTIVMDKFATVADTLHAVVTGVVAPPDPRPVVRAGGPYRFPVGAAQPIAGSVTGGAAPVTLGWDTDQDGVADRSGASFTGSFGSGRSLVTLKATDANGLERRDTTSVLVASVDRLAAETTPLTIVVINDSGINPYHIEFSAETYPDPDVLALTNNFQRHPSEYIPNYPRDATAIRMTTGRGYFPPEDAKLWSLKSASNPTGLEFGKLYWVPGTKIIGAFQPGPLACSNCAAGAHVILDDDGHGTGSSSVSVGNRYGYCGSCLLVLGKGLSSAMTVSSTFPWADINSNSWGTIANAPLDLTLRLIGADPGRPSREAVERGMTMLFASGNGHANAFESPSPVYGTSTAGPDWNVVVGAIRRDAERPIVGDGTPAHLSSWGDGNLPSACRTGVVSQCAFGGTSAATPYTAGVFGWVLTEVRRSIGDTTTGQRAGQVIAEGFPIPGSPYLSDGKLTRAELREAVLKTALPLNQDNAQQIPVFPYPWTAPYQGDINVLFEGYGAATPNSAKRALAVLLGKAPLPTREAEDRFFAIDRQIRDSLWGGYDRDGNGAKESYAALDQFGLGVADVETPLATWMTIQRVAALTAQAETSKLTGYNSMTYWLHRQYSNEPGTTESCSSNITFMDQTNTPGDRDACFENRATSLLAGFRPLGIWPSTSDTTVPIPAGSKVLVELFVATDQATVVRPTGVLMAGDRVLGTGAATPQPTIGSGPYISQGAPIAPPAPLPRGVVIDENRCKELGELCWNKFVWSFTTTRHAIAGEQLTFQVQMIGTRAWSFGYEGAHASNITIVPAEVPAGQLDFEASFAEPAEGATFGEDPFTAFGYVRFPALGTTEAGDHPTRKRVDVSVDDPTFGAPIEATLILNGDETSGSWSAPVGRLTPGAHTLYVRASLDRNHSPVAQRGITVNDTRTTPRIQWQIVPRGASPGANGWQPANGLVSWQFAFDTATYGAGDFDIYSRLVEQGLQTAITSVKARFR